MSGTTQADVIDTLLKGIRSNLTDQTILVADGFPGTNEPVIIVTVGGTSNPTADGLQEWAYLGAKTKMEKYKIIVVVSVVYGGDGINSETAGDAQKAARDAAYSVAHTIESYLIADPTLGQYFNTGRLKGGWAGLEDMRLVQSDDINAATGAIAEVHMTVKITALI